MERCMQEIGTVHKQGWLSKSPPITQFNGSKLWKRRFFVILQINPDKGNLFRNASKKGSVEMNDLHDFYLVYWESDVERKKMGSQSLSAIPLLGHYHVHKYLSYEQKYEHVVLLVTDNRVYFLSAENETEMNSWYHYLGKALNWVRAKSIPEIKDVDQNGSFDDKSEISDDYCERVDLPPVPRESWTMPKRFDPCIDSDEVSSSTIDLSDDPSVRSTSSSPRSKSTLLKRCSFGSVHGYYSHERSPSNTTLAYDIAKEMECLDGNRNLPYGHSYERKRRTSMSSTSFHRYRSRNVYAEHPSIFDDKPNRSYDEKISKQENLSPSSSFPPLPKEILLQESTEEVKETVKADNKTQSDAKHVYNYSNHELYNFTKGPDSATLNLFESPVKLPSNTITNVTNDGLQIKYGDHEILIRRLKKISDDIIEV